MSSSVFCFTLVSPGDNRNEIDTVVTRGFFIFVLYNIFMSDSIQEVPSGDIDGINTIYETSVAYTPGTLWIYRDGQLIHRDDDDGWIELGGKRFEVKRPFYPGDKIYVWYSVGAPIPGAFWRPPSGYVSIDLRPSPYQVIELTPGGYGVSDEQSADLSVPDGQSAIELSPRAESVLNLVPTPVSSEVI